MAKTDSVQTRVSITSVSTTAVFNEISNYVDTLSGFNVEAMTQETHAFGDSFAEHAFTGVKRIDDITLGGFFDNAAATGPHVLLGPANLGGERVLKVYLTTGESHKVDVIVAKYSAHPTRGELTRFESLLRPTGPYVTST